MPQTFVLMLRWCYLAQHDMHAAQLSEAGQVRDNECSSRMRLHQRACAIDIVNSAVAGTEAPAPARLTAVHPTLARLLPAAAAAPAGPRRGMPAQLQSLHTAHSRSMLTGSLARVAVAAVRPRRLPLQHSVTRLRALASSAAETARWAGCHVCAGQD